MSEESFRRRYTEDVYRRGVTLVEKADNHDCIFYDRQRGCTVYEDRPRQCRTWPFWRPLLKIGKAGLRRPRIVPAWIAANYTMLKRLPK